MLKSCRFFSAISRLCRNGILLPFIMATAVVVFALQAEAYSGPVSQAEAIDSMENFRVMSFNIRYGTADDKENAWPLRRDLVTDIIDRYQPQLLGVQEALEFQIEEIIEKLPEYGFIGKGRDDGEKKGEFSAILYLKDRYRVISHDTFWLSDTPEKPGSASWGNTIPRIVTWAELEDTRLERRIYIFNTHFDHQSQPSREKSSRLLVERVLSRDDISIPAVITGDFNAGEYNPAIRYMVEDQPITMGSGESLTNPQPFKDAFRTRNPEAVKVGTFNRFEGYSVGEKIDYIFSSGDLSIIDSMIIRDNNQGRYPSDHFPVIADFSF